MDVGPPYPPPRLLPIVKIRPASTRGRIAALMSLLAAAIPATGQTFNLIAPSDALGIWNFDETSNTSQSADLLTGTPIGLQGNATFSSDGGGRGSQNGDRALDFGTAGNSSAQITDSAFLALLNERNLTTDQLSVVFWQRWDSSTGNSSTVYFRSAASHGRGFQAHLPWSDNNIYFDHSGCCDTPAQRLVVASGSIPGLDWQQWTHVALIKNGGSKQIWINGQLAAAQTSGVSPLTGDWTELLFGQSPGSPSMPLKGRIDDLAIFATALDPSHIAALAAGSSPVDLVVAPADRPPAMPSFIPQAGTRFHPVTGGLGFTVKTVSPNAIAPSALRLFLNGKDITSTLDVSGNPQDLSVSSSAIMLPNRFYSARAEATDQAGRTTTRSWTFDTADPATIPAHVPLDLMTMAASTSPGGPARQAVDDNPATFIETANTAGSFLELELDRHVRCSRIDLVAPTGSSYAGILTGTRLQVFGLRDQLLFETTVTAIEPGGTWAVFLPTGIDARLLRLSLPPGQTNGRGDQRLALAEWRVLGDPSPAAGPLAIATITTASQSTTTGTNTATFALDGDASTVSETQNLANSHWQLTLDRARPVRRVELVAPADATSTRLGGLTLRLLDADSNTLATTTVTHPGPGGTWSFDFPAHTPDARFLRLGLENNALNGYGDRVVSLAGVSVFTGTNHALGTPAYMVRLNDSLPSPALANDGNHATFTETTTATVDGYWETDLGQVRHLHAIRVVAFDGTAHQQRLTHATVRLFDENHDSIFSRKLTGNSATFDLALPGPLPARYVRVGFENKERSSADGGIEWWLRLREVQAFGLPERPTGITAFTATPASISAGQSSTLAWQEQDLHELVLHPAIGSVGALTTPSGTGSRVVSPTTSTEFLLVGKSQNGPVTRAVTVTVGNQRLPLRISEFVASNRFSLRDGYRDEPDWIELHNPNPVAIALDNHGLSDAPATPRKWIFPAGTSIPANGHLVVFASGNATPVDPAGNLHANFSLSAAGESVVLAAPNGSVIDSIPNYPPQINDLAYGRALDGSLAFFQPSPRSHNLSAPLVGWLAPPAFSHDRGFHDSAFSLVLSHPDPAAQILYSLDGSEPSLPYTGPIAIATNRSVRATARRAGHHPPAVATHSYLFRDSIMSSPLMNSSYTQGPLATRLRNSLTAIPTVCLSVPVLPDDYLERPASVEVFLPDGSPPLQVNAGLARFGGSYTEFAKKSYRVRFRSAYGAKRLESPLFRGFDRGMAALDEIDTLDLSAGNHDMVERGFYMSNRFVEDTMLEMGSLNPHGRFVHVYINGTYWGQYNAHERLDDDFLAGYLGGSDEDYLVVRGNDNSGDDFVNGTPDPEHRDSWETVRANRNSYLAVKDRVDVAHLIDFMLLWFYGNSEAEFRCAGPVNPGTGFKFWLADADGFLRTAALNLDTTTNSGPGGLFGALLAEGHPDFKILLADRIHRHFFNNGALTPARNLARLNARMTEVRDSLIAECARWGYRAPTDWESSAETIRTGLFPERSANLLALFQSRGFYPSLAAPVFGQHGGSVPKGHVLPVSAGAGTIYYTLDGSDPRLPGGAISPTALTAVATSATFIPLGSSWRFRDVGALPAANWASPAYNDSAWNSGNAPLGYGTSDEATVVASGPDPSNKFPTTYFRKSFTVANPSVVTAMTLSLVRDDGAVVYLNGTEVARSNMPAGAIGYSTLASSTIGGGDKFIVHTFSIPPSLLVAGDNLLAVEVHQATPTSTDLRFDLSLVQSSSPSIILNGNTSVKARLRSGTTWSALTAADFQVTHPLASAGPYTMSSWAANSPAGSAPPNLRFFQSDQQDPALATPMDLPWTLAYNLTSRSRINGLGAPGIGFINTSDPQPVAGAGFVGAAVLALDTRGTQDIRVRWTGGTVAPNDRDYGIRLQYRIGNTTSFLDVTGPGGTPVEYLRSANAGHSSVIGPVSLPAAADNQPLVELRWKYYFRSGDSGARPQLRLDEIQVSAGPVVAESLVFASTPPAAQAGRTAPPFVVHAIGRNGVVAENFNGPITLASASGTPGGTLTRNAIGGVATFPDLVFPGPGLQSLTASASGLAPASQSFPTRVAALTALVSPAFIQGAQPENSLRVPHASLLRIDGLRPSATYRYANQFVTDDDASDSSGAGNMIFATGHTGPFVRSTESPRFLPADLLVRHGEFTTGPDGSHTGWFVTEPTGNLRFTPGNTLRARLLLNDGDGGDVTFHNLTAAPGARVLAFGSGPADGSALHGDSAAPARDFVVLYADPDGLTPPLAATPVEDSGAATDTTYAAFYRSEVAGRPGRFGTILPNLLPAGVRRFEHRDRLSGQVLSVFAAPEGHALTTGLATGSQSTGIRFPATNSGFARWQALRFPLAQLTDPVHGGPAGDPDADGFDNSLEYVLGGDPATADPAIAPQLDASGSDFVFTFTRRAESAADTSQTFQFSRTPGLWTNLNLATPDPRVVLSPVTGGHQQVTITLPKADTSRLFGRLTVTQP